MGLTQQKPTKTAPTKIVASPGTTKKMPLAKGPLRLSVLGATGSIGKNTLDLISRDPENYDVACLTAHSNSEALASLARHHNAERAIIADESHFQALRELLAGTGIKVAAGEAAIIEAACEPVDCVVAAIVGAAGLKPAFAALSQGNRLALANKECLVCAGDIFMREASLHGTELLPVDSEHSAAFQSLANADHNAIENITLTASGGPFRDWPIQKIARATPSQALNHPNWSMGDKVTIDSATMMNKGLELIEAYHLFPVTSDKLNVVVHPQSIIHCLVSFIDGSVIAQLSEPDMRTPIALALSWPQRMSAPTKRLDLVELGKLTFEAPDEQRFPALALARQALTRGDAAPAILNAANEIAVQAFLGGEINFLEICKTVEVVLDEAEACGLIMPLTNITEALEIDHEARHIAMTHIK